MTDFLDQSIFMSLKDINKYNLNFKGIYALGIQDHSKLPKLFKEEVVDGSGFIIYIGKSSRNLKNRMMEECEGKGHGTFFRGIGALLDFKPAKGSLIGKKNKNNYVFTNQDRQKIVEWMNNNLCFNFMKIENDLDLIEKHLVMQLSPILNTIHNPFKSKLLADKRKKCRSYALSSPV